MLRLFPAIGLAAFLAAAAAGNACAADAGASESANDAAIPDAAELDRQTQQLKSDLLDLEADVDALETEARYPAAIRWTVYVTADKLPDFTLDRVRLQVDGAAVANHEYSEAERSALTQRGAQQLHLGNLETGRHTLQAHIEGQLGGQPFSRTQTFTVDKREGAQLLELHLAAGVAAAGDDAPARPGLVAHSYADDS